MSVEDGSLNMPYEEGPNFTMPDVPKVSGGVVVMSATIPDPTTSGGFLPGLVFRFVDAATGQFMQPILLVADADEIGNLVQLVTKAADGAVKAAERRQ